jgi:hypothetical protein
MWWYPAVMAMYFVQSQGVYGSEVLASREEAKRSKLQQLEPAAFKSGGTATILDPVVNYTPGISNVGPCSAFSQTCFLAVLE